jgi:hypothetical protein
MKVSRRKLLNNDLQHILTHTALFPRQDLSCIRRAQKHRFRYEQYILDRGFPGIDYDHARLCCGPNKSLSGYPSIVGNFGVTVLINIVGNFKFI